MGATNIASVDERFRGAASVRANAGARKKMSVSAGGGRSSAWNGGCDAVLKNPPLQFGKTLCSSPLVPASA
jgi:hypothetical protein